MNADDSTASKAAPLRSRSFFANRLTHSQKLVFGVVPVLFLAAATAFAAYNYLPNSGSASNSEAPPNLLPAETIRLELVEAYEISHAFVGKLEARRKSQLGFERGGLLVEVLKDEGDSVGSGEPIARLDTLNLASRREELVAQRKRAEAQLAEMEAGPRQEVIAAAKADLEQWQARYRQAKLRAVRQQVLYQRNSASEQERDDALYQAEATLAQQKAAESRLQELLNGTRQEQIDAQAALVQQLKSQIATLDIDLEKSVLRAPFAGTIAQRQRDEGAVLSAGEPVVELLETASLQARIGVSSGMSEELQVGQTYVLSVRGQELKGTVRAIRPDRNPHTRTVTVLLDVTAGQHGLYIDDLVTLRLQQAIPKRGYWVPARALVESIRGLWSCYVALPEADTQGIYRLERREVEVIHQETGRAFVRGTLRPEELVVADGNHRLVPGQLVRLSEPPNEQADNTDRVAFAEERQ